MRDHRGARLCTGGEMQNQHRGKYLPYPAVLLFILEQQLILLQFYRYEVKAGRDTCFSLCQNGGIYEKYR